MAFNCEISFDPSAALTQNLASVFAGLSILEKEGYIKIKKINQCFDFKKSGKYPNRLILEIKIEEKVIAIDISDGYQDIHSPEFLDSILDNIDFYFKTSYDPEFANKLRNKDKFKQFGLLFRSTDIGNVFEKEIIKYYFNTKNYKSALSVLINKANIQKNDSFKNFISCDHYDFYNILMWSRLWDTKPLPPENYLKIYPELSMEDAIRKSKYSYEMHMEVNNERIRTIRCLKETFGDRFIGGLSDDVPSRQMAPDLIVNDDRIMMRDRYIETLKSNVVSVLSKGLHGCIGARYGESLAAGRAIFTDKLKYELYGGFCEGKNYIEYADSDSLISEITDFIDDIDAIHTMEENNEKYYREYLRPDVLIKRVIDTAMNIV